MTPASRDCSKSSGKTLDEMNVARLCSDLVKINSENPPGDTRDVISYLRECTDSLGLQMRLVRNRGGKHNLLSKKPAGNLLFLGHVDVVPALAEGWDRDPNSARAGTTSTCRTGGCRLVFSRAGCIPSPVPDQPHRRPKRIGTLPDEMARVSPGGSRCLDLTRSEQRRATFISPGIFYKQSREAGVTVKAFQEIGFKEVFNHVVEGVGPNSCRASGSSTKCGTPTTARYTVS